MTIIVNLTWTRHKIAPNSTSATDLTSSLPIVTAIRTKKKKHTTMTRSNGLFKILAMFLLQSQTMLVPYRRPISGRGYSFWFGCLYAWCDSGAIYNRWHFCCACAYYRIIPGILIIVSLTRRRIIVLIQHDKILHKFF